MKTSELTGAALDWAVAKADEERDVLFCQRQYGRLLVRTPGNHETHDSEWPYAPSTDWAQGGPIIEREAMCISRTNKTREEPWAAYIDGYYWIDGPTPLIAAMRCYVASKLGDNIDIPEELR